VIYTVITWSNDFVLFNIGDGEHSYLTLTEHILMGHGALTTEQRWSGGQHGTTVSEVCE
jgi:hypothetical protein